MKSTVSQQVGKVQVGNVSYKIEKTWNKPPDLFTYGLYVIYNSVVRGLNPFVVIWPFPVASWVCFTPADRSTFKLHSAHDSPVLFTLSDTLNPSLTSQRRQKSVNGMSDNDLEASSFALSFLKTKRSTITYKHTHSQPPLFHPGLASLWPWSELLYGPRWPYPATL